MLYINCWLKYKLLVMVGGTSREFRKYITTTNGPHPKFSTKNVMLP